MITLTILSVTNVAKAQSAKQSRDSAKVAMTTNLVNTQSFVFVLQFVMPSTGGTRHLTSYYNLDVFKDSVISYLPYFGRAYSPPINSTDIAFSFTSTNFYYKVTPGKKGSWNILIKPKDISNVQQLNLQVFNNSSASLNITSVNRDAISYQDYITARKEKKI